MRVLVTGANGFTGQYVIKQLLSEGHDVTGTVTATPSAVLPPDKQIRMNLLEPQQIQQAVSQARPEAVIHLAAVSYVGHGNPADFYTANVIGTRNLLEVLAEQKSALKKVMLASSANVYGNATQSVLSESVAPAPANDYAVSKLAMEHMAWLWADRLPLLVTRPFNYTGIGQSTRFLIAKIVDHYRRRANVIKLGNLEIARDFSDVRYIATAYGALLSSELTGTTVNLCSGNSWSLRAILQMCEDITGHKIEVQVDPALVRSSEVTKLCGDNTQLKKFLPHLPVALSETLEWMLNE